MKKPFFQHFILLLGVLALAACGFNPPKTNLAPNLYPNAYIAEPIKLRAGVEHATQEFEIKDPKEWLEVSLGFERRDDLMPFKRFQCLVMARKDLMRIDDQPTVKCPDDEPGISVQWKLFRVNGNQLRSVAGAHYDALKNNTGGTSSKNSRTVGLGGAGQNPAGRYRVIIAVMRDFPELDQTNPHILVNLPFFRRR